MYSDLQLTMKLLPQLRALVLATLCTSRAFAQSPADPLAEARRQAAIGHLNEAEAAVRSYLTDHPTSADGHFLLGYVLFREKKATESLAQFTEGAKSRRPNPTELKTVASDYVLLGAFEDADKWFSEITKETPDDAEIWYLLGRTKYNEGMLVEAVSSFTHALALREKYVEAENNLGLAYYGLNKLEQAKTSYKNAIDWQGANPNDGQPFLNLGILLMEEGDQDAAISHLTRATSLLPENPSAHERLGAAYEAKNRIAEAKVEMELAVALAPNASGIHFKLAGIYKKLGMKDQARRELEICVKLNNTHSSHETPNPPLQH